VVTPTKDSQYPELEKLVKEIKQGKRIVLYPVGGVSFVAVIMLLIVSFVTLTSPLIYVIGNDWEIGVKGNTQMFGVLLAGLCILFPSALIIFGKKKLQRWFIFFSAFIAFSAAISIVAGYLFDIEINSISLFISLATASLATYLAQSARYRAFTYFRFFLHRKD